MGETATGGRTMAWVRAHPRLVEFLLLLVIAVPCLQPKLLRMGTYPIGPDGSLYMDVAQHTLAGDGLVTGLSLYHQGYPVLPHPTSVQPLWPMLLAAAGALMPLPVAAVWVPSLLWGVSLGLAFLWGRRVLPSLLPSWRGVTAPTQLLHGGHVVVAVLGLSWFFESYTSRPYTEGLSFALLFGSFLRAPGLVERRSLRDAAELGLWLALHFYARSQHLILVLAAPCLLLWLLWREPTRRRQTLLFGAFGFAVFALAFLPELLWVGSFVEGNALHAYLRFDQARVASALSDAAGLRSGESLLATVADRLGGVRVAFGPEGYVKVFGFHAAVLPLALLACVTAPRRAWRILVAMVDGHGVAFISGVGAVLLLHLMHKDLGHAWWFGDRHALLAIVLFAFAYAMCARRGGPWLWLALALFVGATGHEAVDRWQTRARKPYKVLAHRLDLQARLLALAAAQEAPLVVAMHSTQARYLAWLVPGVGFHALIEQTSYEDLEIMVCELGVRYVVTFGPLQGPYAKDARFEERFELVDSFASPEQRTRKLEAGDIIRLWRAPPVAACGRGPAE